MKRSNRKRSPRVEELESLTLLSGVSTSLAQPAAVVAEAPGRVRALATLKLAGVARGVASFGKASPDAGTTYTIGGNGTVSPLGRVVVSGTLLSTGFVLEGRAIGALTLYGHKGSLTLQLSGPTQSGFAPLPPAFGFTIIGATGNLAGAAGGGSVLVSFRPARPSLGLPNGTGSITLTFRPF